VSSDSRRSNIDRWAARGSTRPLMRANRNDSAAVQRVGSRADGPSLTRAPDSIEVVASSSNQVGAGDARAMRSEIARQINDLVTLSAERGLLRKRVEAARAEAPAEEEGGPETNPLQDWWDALEAQGLRTPEIEEMLVDRLRSLRRGMLALDASRKVGRR